MTEPTTYPGNEQDYKGYHADWPQSVRELAGSWQKFPQQEELCAEQGENIPRESYWNKL